MKRALVCLLLTGCATTATRDWVDDATLQFDPTKYSDDAAVILYRSDKTTLQLEGSESLTRRERHEVIAVRGEAGFWMAEVKVPYRAQDTLAGFRARLVQPDGSKQEFDAKNFLSDVSARGERQVNAAFFRFPGVKVGSILEYWWVVEGEKFWAADEQETLGEYPVKKYEFELTAAKPLVVETIEWNDAQPIDVRTFADGRHQLRFTLNDLPPRERVDFAPNFTFSEPRWAWRVLAWRDKKLSYDWLRDWSNVVEDNGKRFYTEGKLEKGFDQQLDTADVGACKGDVACLVGLAQKFVFSDAEDVDKWDRAEPLALALASGRTSIVERALMMRLLLERAGVEAWVAYGTDALSNQLAPGFPRLDQFNHLFVYLPRQKGLQTPLTIDPDCHFCGPGMLTSRHREQRIYVFRTRQEVSDFATEGRWETAFGSAAPISEKRFTHVARVEADGTVSDTITTRTSGLEANRPFDDFKHRERKLLQREADEWNRSNGMKSISDAHWSECKRSKGVCSWSSKLRFPAQAWKNGDNWTVHLGFLNSIHSELFDAEERKLDVHFTWDDRSVVEVLELTAPMGTRLVSVPPPQNFNAGSLRTSVEVERTPTGARVTRRIDTTIGFENKARYPELRAAADAFKRARQLVLEFAPEAKPQ
ncbi:MAG: DUF3857 domain-containing protein [Archangium sp.]